VLPGHSADENPHGAHDGVVPKDVSKAGVNPQTETGFSTSQNGATISSGWTTRELSRQPRLRVSTEAVHRRNSNSFLSDGMPDGVKSGWQETK